MITSAAQQMHEAKIQAAKRLLEDNNGAAIKQDKIQEWALLEIAEMLRAIHFQLIQLQVSQASSQMGRRG